MIVLYILAALFLLLALLVAPGISTPAQRRPFTGRNFAHRGLYAADQSTPENSMAAFAAAIAAGYGIELDIQLSRDGQVVVFHDDTLQRMCGAPGRVDEYDLAELQAMPLHTTDQRMPLFTDVLRLVDGRVPLIVELKTGPRNAQLCAKAWQQLLPYTGAFCIESFDPRILHWWRLHAKQVLRGQLTASCRTLRKSQSLPVSFAASRCLLNVLGRPQFIAHEKGQRNLGHGLALAMGAMPVVWTAHPEDDTAALQAKNKAVIFEHYTPHIKY